jgi:hypothetical protein
VYSFCCIQFVGLSALVSAFLLRPEELRILKKSEVAQVLGLGVVSLVGFLISGAELALGISMLWLVGALVGGVSSIEAAFRLRLPSPKTSLQSR